MSDLSRFSWILQGEGRGMPLRGGYARVMQQVATRRRSQPPPARFMFEALIDPYRQPARHWLELLESEISPEIVRL